MLYLYGSALLAAAPLVAADSPSKTAVPTLSAGAVALQYEQRGEPFARRHGMTNAVVLSPVKGEIGDAVRKAKGPGVVTLISVTDTPLVFALHNGVVQPFIGDSDKHETWEFRGLDAMFLKTRWIIQNTKRITFGGVEGLADTDLFWTFDFSRQTGGMAVIFSADGGW